MDLKLKDKVVLIIAATGDSGTATAKAFANEGCTLAVTSTSQAKLDAPRTRNNVFMVRSSLM